MLHKNIIFIHFMITFLGFQTSMLTSVGVVWLTGQEILAYFSIRYIGRASPATATGITPALTALVWSPASLRTVTYK